MAAAYRVVDRTHAPLTSPLEDPNPSTAHLKMHWPSSFQRLQETFLLSDFFPGTEYSSFKPQSSQFYTEDLIVFNVYKFGLQFPIYIYITFVYLVRWLEPPIARSAGAWVHLPYPHFILDIRLYTQRIELSQNYRGRFRWSVRVGFSPPTSTES